MAVFLVSRYTPRLLRFAQGRQAEDEVGPGGIWAVEVKAFRPTVRVRAGIWERRTRVGWVASREQPGQQAKANAGRLRVFLQREGIDLPWVEPAVALGRPQPVTNFREAQPPVWHLPRIAENVVPVLSPLRLDAEVRARVVATLTREAERQLAREAAK